MVLGRISGKQALSRDGNLYLCSLCCCNVSYSCRLGHFSSFMLEKPMSPTRYDKKATEPENLI